MSFFNAVLRDNDLEKHDGRALWKYKISNQNVEDFRGALLNQTIGSIQSTDAALYYAYWWQHIYNGGKPSKTQVLEGTHLSLFGEEKAEVFYEKAKEGAERLGITWIKRQNTLYFKTLLLQGGIPVKHLGNNKGAYMNFLRAVLDIQPESIEDFCDDENITNHLPQSSRNDIIYQSCFEIIRAVLDDQNDLDGLFEGAEDLKDVLSDLRIRRKGLKKRIARFKPNNAWSLDLVNGKISLQINLRPTYTKESLAALLELNEEAEEREYSLFLDNNLLCKFRRLLNGNYKLEMYSKASIPWNGEEEYPEVYFLANEKKQILNTFIDIVPSLTEPTLWTRVSENSWRLVKGNSTLNQNVAVLSPPQYTLPGDFEVLKVSESEVLWKTFEGELKLSYLDEEHTFYANLESLNWTVVQHKPEWMLKSNLAVIKNNLEVFIYDSENQRVTKKSKLYWRKHRSKNDWTRFYHRGEVPVGCLDVKIDSEGLVGYDVVFNIGDLNLSYKDQKIDSGRIVTENTQTLKLALYETGPLKIDHSENEYILTLNLEEKLIPTSIKASYGSKGIRKLKFDILTPFKGLQVINQNGEKVDPNTTLFLDRLPGLRILGSSSFRLRFKNTGDLNQEIRISKEAGTLQPLSVFAEEIKRLYYLGDVMKHQNKVEMELNDGANKISYEFSLFSHTLEVKDQFNGKVSIYESDDELSLFAIPLYCKPENISPIELEFYEGHYLLPQNDISQQFVIISSAENGNKLMPRFVKTSEDIHSLGTNERISAYHDKLLAASFKNDIWREVLAYFKVCVNYDLPFSTFDQLRALSRSSALASMAFFFLGMNQEDIDEFIQKSVRELELDLGFCFHWISMADWGKSFMQANSLYEEDCFSSITQIMRLYFEEQELEAVSFLISNNQDIEAKVITNEDIRSLRSELGHRVLEELPDGSPKNVENDILPVMNHQQVRLLIQSPIAVSDSIKGKQWEKISIWSGDDYREKIRRNIQYAQYLNKEFYNRVLLYALTK
ncbi:MAG: hypothetical protein COA58_03270 [Bacteroidetes bacterium]|nr:MAG: hypothetical protein COA58_03270 [Bacteroidota bacterium]